MTQAKVNTRPFDAAHYLNSEEDIAAYLEVVLEDDDPRLLAVALGDIARARGMTELAKKQACRVKACTKACLGSVYPTLKRCLRSSMLWDSS